MSFRLKTLLGIATIEAVLLLILIAYSMDFLRTSNEEQIVKRAYTYANLFSASVKDAVISNDLASLDSFVHEVMKSPDLIYARVLNSKGVVLAEAGDTTELPVPFVADDKILFDDDHKVFNSFAKIREANILFGRVELGFSTQDLVVLVSNVKKKATSIAILEMGLVAIFSLVLGAYLTRQLKDLRVASKKIAQSDFDYQIPIKGNDELAETAKAFNEMSLQVKNTYKKLHNKEHKVSAIINNVTNGIISLDARGYIESLNPAAEKIFGLASNKIVGKHFDQLVPDDGINMLLEKNDDGKELDNLIYKTQIKTNDNKEKILEITINSSFLNKDIIYTIVVHDITQQYKSEKILKEQKKNAELAADAKSRFLAVMSHEIRTPLNAMIGVTSILQDTTLNTEQKDLLNTASIAGDSLLFLINNILDYSKAEAGEMRLERCNFQLQGLQTEIEDLFSVDLNRKNIKLNFVVNPDVPSYLNGDSGRLRQILINLVGNAIKFTDNGSIEVVARLTAKTIASNKIRLEFQVKDTGIGISEIAQQNLFTEFSQQDPSFSRKYGGTGLGLAICKKIVELMGGEIHCQSKEGKGTNFIFYVNMWEAEEENIAAPFQNQGEITPNMPITLATKLKNPKRILLAEDSPANQVVALAMLRKEGFVVDAVANGKEAVIALSNFPYHAVLMDLMMPEMDGFEATKCIRNMDGSRAEVPIIAMTANAMQGDREACLRSGMDDYLSKPINKKLLITKLGHWLNKTTDTKHIESTKPDENENNAGLIDIPTITQLEKDTGAEYTEEIVKIFLEETIQRIDVVRWAFENRNYDKIQQEIHVIKSTAGTYGVLKMQEIALALDTAYKNGQYEYIDNEMESFFDIAKESIEKLTEYFLINDMKNEVSNG